MPARYPLRDLLALLGAATLAYSLVAWLVPAAPYTDAAYYALVAERLATGQGFTVPVLYSFLEVGGMLPADPSLPVPSNGHWMPLTSIAAAIPMALFGPDWRAGQIPMVLLATALVGISHRVTWELWEDRGLAVAAGLLMLFPGQLLAMLPQVDGTAVFGVLGSLALWTSFRAASARRWGWWLIAAGVLIGLATLARIDGVLLTVAPFVVWLRRRHDTGGERSVRIALMSAGAFLFVLAPWLLRNLAVFGAILPSTGGHTLWITSYNEQFAIGREVSLSTYLDWGLGPIVASKVSAGAVLLGRTLAVAGGIVALFFLAGAWRLRRKPDLHPYIAYWLLMFGAMALLFTFHAPYGAFVHSAPAWLPFAFAIAVGSVRPVAVSLGRWWGFLRRPATHRFLLGASVAGAVLLSVASSAVLLGQWRFAAHRLAPASTYLAQSVPRDEVVMFADPARLNLLTGHPAVAAPFDPFDTISKVVRAYGVRWVVVALDVGETRDPLGLWDGAHAVDATGESPDFLPADPAFEADGVRVYEVVH